jgi:hypothetical protein
MLKVLHRLDGQQKQGYLISYASELGTKLH